MQKARMKSSTLMAIMLVVQAVLIMGVFAAVSIENSAAPAVGEEDSVGPLHPGTLTCCKKCNPIDNSGQFQCGDVFKTAEDCTKANCFSCEKYRSSEYKCNNVFNGECGPKECKKN